MFIVVHKETRNIRHILDKRPVAVTDNLEIVEQDVDKAILQDFKLHCMKYHLIGDKIIKLEDNENAGNT